jgi:alginate O-acetyltransferase complex protein AlgI
VPFNSYLFIFAFLPAAMGGFWLAWRFRDRAAALAWLIVASIIFYAYSGILSLFIILPFILIDYLIARQLLRMEHSRKELRRALFVLGVLINVLFLGYFKYRGFFADTTNAMFSTNIKLAEIVVPLGVSFIVFQKIAFLADVHAGQVAAVRLPDYLLFTLFFPKMLAGPIVRYRELVPQLNRSESSSFMSNAPVAICLFSVGLFKKSILADGVAQFVPYAFDNGAAGSSLTLLTAWTGVLAYTFELYFDFSGYSDMALGIARLFGVKLPMNFNSPYKACSIVEFWSRWHITLTRFLTDYVYTPMVVHLTRLRMSRGRAVLRGKRSTWGAIGLLVGAPTLITMSISGLWHGAGWQFIVWGVLHGSYLTINQSWRILRPRFWTDQVSYDTVMKPVGFVLTFGAVVVAFAFFRAPDVSSGLAVLRAMADGNGILPPDVEMLRHLGTSLEWTMITHYWQPVAPFIWIAALFAVVTLLPNSLELLRRFQPAVDFPEGMETERTLGASLPIGMEPPLEAASTSTPPWFRAGWNAVSRIRHEGISLSGTTATVAAGLCVLGLIALNHGSAFLYWKF